MLTAASIDFMSCPRPSRRIQICVIVAALLLAACHPPYRMALMNNTEDSIMVSKVDGTNGSGKRFRNTQISTNARKVFSRGTTTDGWRVEFRLANCVLNYDFPIARHPDNFPESSIPADIRFATFQVESNGRIYLIPSEFRSPVEIEKVAKLQPEGFPIEPAQKDCD